MIRSTTIAAASLIIVFVAAAMLLTAQSRSVVAQHRISDGAQVSNQTTTRLASVSTQPLVRSTYMLPADAAELLTKLFEHKATASIECATDDEQAEDNKGLVKFEITAEPKTQKAIDAFMASVFPADKIKAYTAEKSVSKTKTVSLKLPNMT